MHMLFSRKPSVRICYRIRSRVQVTPAARLPFPLYPTGFGPGTVLSGKKNGTPKLFDKPVRDAGGDPTAVRRYADRKGLVKRESERTIRKNVRIGKLQLRCVIIQIPNEG